MPLPDSLPDNARHPTISSLIEASLQRFAPVNLVNAVIPTSGLTIDRNIPYGAHPRQRLDVYAPKNGGADRPVAVFFYGGGWQMGDRREYLFAAQAFASRGMTVVVPDYRIFPEVTFPAFIDDAAAVVAWTARNIAAAKGKVHNILPIGHSAGAYIALMLALDQRYLAQVGTQETQLAGAVGISGPYDFLPIIRTDVKPIFEVLADLSQTQPIRHARIDAPPLLLLAGEADIVVDPANAMRLAGRLRTLGGRAEFRLYPGVGHVGAVAALAPVLRRRAPILDDIDSFVRGLSRP